MMDQSDLSFAWIDINIATMDPQRVNSYGAIENGAIAM